MCVCVFIETSCEQCTVHTSIIYVCSISIAPTYSSVSVNTLFHLPKYRYGGVNVKYICVMSIPVLKVNRNFSVLKVKQNIKTCTLFAAGNHAV